MRIKKIAFAAILVLCLATFLGLLLPIHINEDFKIECSYEGLTPGKAYEAKATLWNLSTDEPIISEGDTITTEMMFLAVESSGTIWLDFSSQDNLPTQVSPLGLGVDWHLFQYDADGNIIEICSAKKSIPSF